MSEIKIIVKDGAIDVESFKKGDGAEVKFIFDGESEGMITVGGISVAVNDSVATVDTASLSDGDHTPLLITPRVSYTLPTIKKEIGGIELSICTTDTLLAISKRVREIENTLTEMLSAIEALNAGINGTILF